MTSLLPGSVLRRALRLPILAVLALILAASGAATASARGQAAAGPLVHLPADQAAHPSAHDEWWYVVGHLRSGSRTFGYEATIFKFLGVRPPGFASAVNIYRTDLAITDEAAHRFLQRTTYYFPQSARLSSTTLDARVGNAHLRSTGTDTLLLNASWSGGAINLRLRSAGPPMYVGGRGFVDFGNQFSYYYSLPNLNASGSLRVGKKAYTVSGISWLDHQWGSWPWQGGVTGWTWMALQLGNGIQISIFDVRGFARPILFASVLGKNGRTTRVPGITVTSSSTWHSPHTGTTYPSIWTVRIPSLRATLHVTPTVTDQEVISPNQPKASYWEGSGRTKGTYGGKPATGLSYTELTGYAAG